MKEKVWERDPVVRAPLSVLRRTRAYADRDARRAGTSTTRLGSARLVASICRSMFGPPLTHSDIVQTNCELEQALGGRADLS